MTTENHLEAVIRQVHTLLATEVTANVELVSYGGDMVEIAELPALVLYLPTLRRRRTEADNEPEQVVDPDAGTITTYQPAQHRDLAFRYELVADPLTLARLLEGLVLFFEHATVAVTRPAKAGGTEMVEYTLSEGQEPAPIAGDGEAHRVAGEFVVIGVQLRPATGDSETLVKTLDLEYYRKED